MVTPNDDYGIKAFEYIHSQDLLHRDISLTNVLVKKYEGLNVVKISDFGLVKTKESNLTSTDSEVKGSLNDPQLDVFKFKNYYIAHETYALTRLIYFVMTGKAKIDKFGDDSLKEFVMRGVSINLEERYKDIAELREAFRKI